MRRIICCITVVVISLLSAQTIIWSYHATGGTYSHIRSIKTIPDVDDDLHEDVIAVSENDTLYCLSGTSGVPIWRFAADPCFVERGLISVPDLNGDSLADVILGTIWGTRSVFAISGADGSVLWQYDTHEYGDGGWIYEVAEMPDVNGDSVVDILASSGGPDALRAYLFDGVTGSKIWEYNTGYACFAVRAIGDISGDTIQDVAVSTGDSDPSTNRVFFLDGATGFLIRDMLLPSTGWSVVPIGDISGDTIPDIACGTANYVILGLSGASDSVLWTCNVGGTVVDLNVLPDVDANGYIELLPSGTGMYNFYCVDALYGSTNWATPAVDQIFVNVAISDINGDSIWDVVGGTGFGNGVLYTLDGSSGTMFWQLAMASPVESAYWIEDVSGNEIPDILVGLRNGWIYAISDGDVGLHEGNVTTVGFESLMSSFGRLELIHNLSSGSKMRVEIYSTLGQKVMDVSLVADRNPISVGVRSLPSGVYFGRISSEESRENVKFVILN